MKIKLWVLTTGLLSLLAACGGGGQLADGGIGGTGISSGSITGFGSIFVNGVQYDVDNAAFMRNGEVASGQDAFSVGEFVTVMGQVNNDGLSGVATEVRFGALLQGVVTAVSGDGVSLEVLGQTVRISPLTVFHGFQQLQDLRLGNMLEISGVNDAQQAIFASSIRLVADSYSEGMTLQLSGKVVEVDPFNQRLQIGNLSVDYASASIQGLPAREPEIGQYLTVSTQTALQEQALHALSLQLQPNALSVVNIAKIEVEGVITRFNSSSNFAVNGIDVLSNSKTEFEYGKASDLALNAFVEVEGSVDSQGVLLAAEIKIKNAKTSTIGELEGAITQLDSAAQTFVIAGQTIEVNNTTLWKDESPLALSHMRFSHLNIQDVVEVKTKPLANGNLLALRVTREGEDDDHTGKDDD